MKIGRYIFHPVLTHPRSRFIFFLFLVLSAVLGGLCWMRITDAFQQAGVSMEEMAAHDPLLRVLISPIFRIILGVIAAWIAAGFTAHHVVGPVDRLELWLETPHREKTPAFRLRKGDKYYKLVQLINRLFKQA
jgi:hypothetical protein